MGAKIDEVVSSFHYDAAAFHVLQVEGIEKLNSICLGLSSNLPRVYPLGYLSVSPYLSLRISFLFLSSICPDPSMAMITMTSLLLKILVFASPTVSSIIPRAANPGLQEIPATATEPNTSNSDTATNKSMPSLSNEVSIRHLWVLQRRPTFWPFVGISFWREDGGSDMMAKVTDICSTDRDDPSHCASFEDIKLVRNKVQVMEELTGKPLQSQPALMGDEYAEKAWWYFAKCWGDLRYSPDTQAETSEELPCALANIFSAARVQPSPHIPALPTIGSPRLPILTTKSGHYRSIPSNTRKIKHHTKRMAGLRTRTGSTQNISRVIISLWMIGYRAKRILITR